MEFKLYRIEKPLKRILTIFLITLTCGVIVGLIFLYQTTGYSDEATVNRINGSKVENEFDIPDYYPKPVSELLITTHNHIIGFSFIFFIIGGIFYFNSTVTGFWKSFLIIEPLISILITFGSLWGIRFIHTGFVYVTIASSTLIYTSYILMAAIIFYELNFKKPSFSV